MPRVVGSRMELFLRGGFILGWALVLSSVWLALFLPAMNPWIGVLVDEPYTLVAAMRVADGQIPYRDFFFLWTPGVIYLHEAIHALTHEWLYSGRIFLILVGLALLWWHQRAAKVAGISKFGRILIWCAALGWGIPQWNQPYASWYAIAVLLLSAIPLGKKNVLAGILIALSFWFKQNIGLYGFFAALAFLLLAKKRSDVLRYLAGWALGILPGFFYFAVHHALLPFLKQTLAFPWTYREVMAFPFTSVPFFHPTRGIFFVVTMIAFPLAWWIFLRNRSGRNLEWSKYLLLSSAGFLQIYPRFDFSHFVFSFSCAVVPFVWGIEECRGIGRRLGYGVLFVLLCAGFWESGANLSETWGGEKVFALRGRGFIHDYLSEIRDVTSYLKKLGVEEGSLVVQIPVTTAFYFYSGLKNGTPHNQFFPMYVETYGENQSEVLAHYLQNGGKYIVVDRNAGAKGYVPVLMGVLERDFFELHRFPLSLSVWAPRSMLKREHDGKERR